MRNQTTITELMVKTTKLLTKQPKGSIINISGYRRSLNPLKCVKYSCDKKNKKNKLNTNFFRFRFFNLTKSMNFKQN